MATSETIFQQNLRYYHSPTTIVICRKHVELYTYNTYDIHVSKSPEVIDNPT